MPSQAAGMDQLRNGYQLLRPGRAEPAAHTEE